MTTSSESEAPVSELRPSYRTLNEPTRLIGLSLSAWAAAIVAGGLAYLFMSVSPLPWRLNFSTVVIGLGGPVILLVVREPGTIGPGRLLAAVIAWRATPTLLEPVVGDQVVPPRRVGVRLDAPPTADTVTETASELPWTDDHDPFPDPADSAEPADDGRGDVV